MTNATTAPSAAPRHGRRVALLAATALAASVLAAPSPRAQEPGPLLRITGRSIFANCTADNVAKQPGTNYPNTEIEPNLAINPADTNNLLVGVQQDRWSNGGARGLRGEYSLDGGTNWASSSTPGVTKCQNGPWQRASDPWVTFSPDGTAYFMSLVVVEKPNPNINGPNGMTVNRSTDGGKTWGPPFTLIQDPGPNTLNDKNAITADPDDSRFVYAVWDRLTVFVTGYGVSDERGGDEGGDALGAALAKATSGSDVAHALVAHAHAVAAGQSKPPTKVFVKGPTYFSRTTDGGQTWEAGRQIYNPGPNAQTIANQVIKLKGNLLADFFTELDDLSNGQPARIGAVYSRDHGATWSLPSYAQMIVNNGAVTPNAGDPIRSADVLFSVATDRTNNITYLVWEDQRFSGVPEVLLAWSPDGFSWTAPVRINQTPRNPLHPLFQQAIIPTVTTLGDGTVVVTYYDFRNDKVGATTDKADYWAVSCNPLTSADNCLSTSDWTNEVRLTDTSFDFDNAPIARGHFLGDYMGLKANGQTAYAVFGQSRQPDLTDLYFRTVTYPTATASAK